MKALWMTRLMLVVSILIITPVVYGQDNTADAARQKTRERLAALLERIGPELKMTFKPHEKATFNFVAQLNTGLKNSDFIEVVIRISKNDTIGIQGYPHYKGGYINLDKARNPTQLMRQLLQFNESTFMFWGADNTGDVFTGYTFTLESGFPDEAIKIVLASIKNSDEYVGKLRPSIDGTTGL